MYLVISCQRGFWLNGHITGVHPQFKQLGLYALLWILVSRINISKQSSIMSQPAKRFIGLALIEVNLSPNFIFQWSFTILIEVTVRTIVCYSNHFLQYCYCLLSYCELYVLSSGGLTSTVVLPVSFLIRGRNFW